MNLFQICRSSLQLIPTLHTIKSQNYCLAFQLLRSSWCDSFFRFPWLLFFVDNQLGSIGVLLLKLAFVLVRLISCVIGFLLCGIVNWGLSLHFHWVQLQHADPHQKCSLPVCVCVWWYSCVHVLLCVCECVRAAFASCCSCSSSFIHSFNPSAAPLPTSPGCRLYAACWRCIVCMCVCVCVLATCGTHCRPTLPWRPYANAPGARRIHVLVCLCVACCHIKYVI